MTTKQTTDDKSAKTQGSKQEAAKKSDAVDEQSKESFPSSDAGSSWAGRDIPPDERKKPS